MSSRAHGPQGHRHLGDAADRLAETISDPAEPPMKLAHIVRRTSRFEEMLRWYQTVLGAEIVHSDGTLAFLTYDHEHHRIRAAHGATPVARGRAAVRRAALRRNPMADAITLYDHHGSPCARRVRAVLNVPR